MAFKTKYLNCRYIFGRIRSVVKVLRFGGQNTFLGGKDFCFYHTFETNFFEHNKILGGTKKIWGELPQNAPPCLRAWAEHRQKVFHWGPSCLCRGARHSENVI